MTLATSPQTRTDTLSVAGKREVAEGVVEVLLRHPEGERLDDWTPGAHIDVRLNDRFVRQYSLCGDRWDPTTYRIAVLRESGGRGGSAYIHDTLAVGDSVGIGGPRNNFRLVPADRYVFVAGGVGITPIVPMIEQARFLDIPWTLIYGGRRRRSMAFLEDLLTLDADSVQVFPQDEVGILNLAPVLSSPQPGTKIYACGPAPMLDAVQQHAADAGWPRQAVRTERFVSRDLNAPARTTAFDVVLARSNRSITVEPGITVLDALRSAGVARLSSCERGVCGTCEITVLAGVPDHRDSILDDDERIAGDCMFPCVSRSRSDQLTLDL